MKVLADTSVWIDYFRYKTPVFAELLLADHILVHEMVIGELSCGTPPAPRATTLRFVRDLATCTLATAEEVTYLIEKEKLYGLGCGWVDLSLLASALMTPTAKLWTLDLRLHQLAERLGVAYSTPIH